MKSSSDNYETPGVLDNSETPAAPRELAKPESPKPKQIRKARIRFKPGKRAPGRPSNKELAQIKRLQTERAREALARSRLPIYGPPAPKGISSRINWGGKREGAGRPRKYGPDQRVKPVYAIPIAFGERVARELNSLEPVERRAYIRKAIELLLDIDPPKHCVPVPLNK